MNDTRRFFQYVIPSVMAFALSGVYTIVDGFFIGNSLGDAGLASITLGFPIAAFIQATGTGIGLAAAIRFAILRGQKKQEESTLCLSSALLLLALSSCLLTAAILLLLPLLLNALGASGALYGLTEEYIRIIALGTIFQLFATGLIPFIRNLGGSAFAMFSMIGGFLTNIILDYLFVWKLETGMAGAALATVIGQAVTMFAAVIFLVRSGTGFRIPDRRSFLQFSRAFLKVSVAPFGLTFSPQITTILMNRALIRFCGSQAVAVYGCIAYITAVAYLLLQGVGDGSQPLISLHFSEGRIGAMRKIRRLAYYSGSCIAVFCIAALYLVRADIGTLFGASSDANMDVARILPLFLLPLILIAYTRITTSFLYATEKSLFSYLLVYAEPVSVFLLLLLLPHILPEEASGVWAALPLAQTLTFGAAVFLMRKIRKSPEEACFGS